MSTDDELRNIFHENVEPVEPPPGVADQLAAKVTETIAASGAGGSAISLPFIIALAAISGLLIGGLLGFVDSRNDPVPASALTAAPIYTCPGDGQVGTLHRGDRVMLIGQSGEWVAVRNIRGSLERVFIHADHVTADAAADLPDADCDDSGVLVIAGEEIATTTTTTTVPETTTTTLDNTATSTTVATTPTTTPTTTTAPTTTSTTSSTTTTVAPDTTAPSISGEAGSPGNIWENDGLGISCSGNPARQAIISATVTDAVGVTSVVATWNTPSGLTTRSMSGGGSSYSATFGPYPAGTWPDASNLVAVTITARDAAGNTSVAAVQIEVHEIGECFI